MSDTYRVEAVQHSRQFMRFTLLKLMQFNTTIMSYIINKSCLSERYKYFFSASFKVLSMYSVVIKLKFVLPIWWISSIVFETIKNITENEISSSPAHHNVHSHHTSQSPKCPSCGRNKGMLSLRNILIKTSIFHEGNKKIDAITI